jgi:hypothetical protein
MFKIESGVPVQTAVKRSAYAEFLGKMKVGQSCAKTEDGKPITEKHVASLRIAAKAMGRGIITRKQPEGGWRVWCVEAKAKAKNGKK